MINMAEKHALASDAESAYENGSFKRQRVEYEGVRGHEQSYSQGGSTGTSFTQPPSPVIHVRGVADEAREQDLLHALDEFGPIR